MPSADYYYLNPNADFSKVGKVVLIQLENKSAYPQVSPDVTSAIYEHLQKKQRFSLRVISENDPDWKSLQLNIDEQWEPKQLIKAAETLKCDAIIVGTITEYVPYPHMMLGLRLKMTSCRDAQMLWAFEQVWDTADRKTEYLIQQYLKNTTRSDSGKLDRQLVNLSSIKFFKFVAYEVARTF
jgi:hypothetical protein